MGRTATAFLVLVAVGGCVADDQGPTAALLAAQQGQPIVVAPPTYATWNRTDQFAVLQDGAPPSDPPPPMPAPVRMTPTTTLKPTAVRKAIIPAPTEKTAPVMDPDLIQATLVQTPGGPEPVGRETYTVAKPVGSNSDFKPMGANSDLKPIGANSDLKPIGANSDLKPIGANSDLKPIGANSDLKPIGANSDLKPIGANPDGEPQVANTTGTPTRMVNSKRITLNYELKDANNSGVTGVELWCTQDTRAWKKGEIIAQTNHSYTVEVKDEGLYGFTLLPRSGSGAGREPPQPGDQPQVWVSVDVTKPVVQIASLDLTHLGKGPGMMIRWTAKDKNMGPRPINLAYAEEPEGPWTPIAAGLENNGQYEWLPTGGVPHHIYLRVEATDLHGNVGLAQTANPMRFDTAGMSVALPQPETPIVRKPQPTPLPTLNGGRPTTAILGVDSNDN